MKSKILTAILSLILAIAIWAYVVTVVSPNSDVKYSNIPVSIQGEAQLHEMGYMVTDMDVTEVDLRLEGNRRDLEKLRSSDIRLTVDVSRNPSAGVHKLPFSIGFTGNADDSAFNILSKEPGTIRVTLEPRISKAIPVEIQYVGSVDNEFMADKENVVKDIEQINIVGPQSEVDQIAKAVVSVDLNGRNKTLSEAYSYAMCDEDGNLVNTKLVTADADQVNVTLKIVRVKEIKLVLTIVEGGGATIDNTEITISPETIWVSGDDNLLEGLEQIELGTVDLGDISEDKSFTLPIKLPEGINDETGVTEASISIAFGDLAVKTLSVSNIEAINVPEGMKVDLLTKVLEIQIRGPMDKLDALSEESIKVTVDFAGTDVGAVKMKADIVIDDPEFGEIGTYSVSATVSASR